MVGFNARSVGELRQAFHEAVADDLATCEEVGKAPQRPYSGKVMLRIPPEVHARTVIKAHAMGKSLNQ